MEEFITVRDISTSYAAPANVPDMRRQAHLRAVQQYLNTRGRMEGTLGAAAAPDGLGQAWNLHLRYDNVQHAFSDVR
ncbi:hypothetical protein [Streptomyces sp. NPDC056401]|uniref:hypothetical protein n=1 Tax=Streptomyces sp. NPDC056401 TaxID=3345809 RepID=UPI0035D71E7F